MHSSLRSEKKKANTDDSKAFYDSMLVKVSCHGSTYEIARRKVLRALVEFRIRGVKTNIPFLATLLTHPVFIQGLCCKYLLVLIFIS
jgi:pyruvate carboxylase